MKKRMQLKDLWKASKRAAALKGSLDHGPAHWGRVYENAVLLLELEVGEHDVEQRSEYKTALKMLELFAMFHDCKREHEVDDPQHGDRSACYLRRLLLRATDLSYPRNTPLGRYLRNYYDLSAANVVTVIDAIRYHNIPMGNPAELSDLQKIMIDADRLDLGRVGITPDPDLLYTASAKSLARRKVLDFRPQAFAQRFVPMNRYGLYNGQPIN